MSDETTKITVSKNTPLPKKSWPQRIIAIVIILGLLTAGVFASKHLIKTKPEAKRRPPKKMQAVVKILEAAKISTNVTVKALGRIIPAKKITLQSQVSGTVAYIHPEMIPGGIIKQGEIMVQLDDTDYQLALSQRKNNLEKAKADLRIEEGNQTVAREEWKLINKITGDLDISAEDIALRAPQLSKVQMNIQAAETDLEKATIDLNRTIIKAPFDLIIDTKNIDLGSQVSTQSAIATLIGIDSYWAEISVPTSKLSWITLPGEKSKGSAASIFSGDNEYRGRIIKILPDLEKDGLMARLLVEIPDPLGLKSRKSPLLLNSFTKAEIAGKHIKDVIKIPRSSLQENKLVYLMTEENTLHIQPVKVLWENTDSVFIEQGIEPGDKIIISSLPSPIEGMPLSLAGAKKGPEQRQKTAEQDKSNNKKGPLNRE